jgi:hypothetical protein
VEVVETGCGRSGCDFSDGLGSEGLSEGGRKILNQIRFDHATSYAGTYQGRTAYDLNTHATKPAQVEGPVLGEELLTQAISLENSMGPHGKKEKEQSGAQMLLAGTQRGGTT